MINPGNNGAFHRYANSKLKSKVNVASLITLSSGVTSDPIDIELLEENFSSIFQTDNNIIPSGRQPLPVLSFDQSIYDCKS